MFVYLYRSGEKLIMFAWVQIMQGQFMGLEVRFFGFFFPLGDILKILLAYWMF